MKKAAAISEKRLWTPLQKSFWIRIIPGTTVPWNGFDQTEKGCLLYTSNRPYDMEEPNFFGLYTMGYIARCSIRCV